MILKKFNDGSARKYQTGGAMMAPGAEQGAPVEATPAEGAPVQGGAEEQLAQISQQLLQMLLQELGDPNAVAAVLQMALEMLTQASQGGAPEGQPVFKKGGKLAKAKKACGGLRVK